MNNKEKFISEIENILTNGITLSTEAMTFFNELKILKASKAVDITENGRKILTFMKENKDSYNNIFKAKEIIITIFIFFHKSQYFSAIFSNINSFTSF